MLSAIASDVANRGKTSYFVNKDKKSVQLTLFFCLYLLMLFLFYPNTPAQAAAYLAMVVPETWLSRDYAAPIQYLLLKCFRVETVAIDTNASWFPEAPVKTCLIVAKRTEMQSIGKSEQYITRIVETDKSVEQPTTTLFPHLRGVKDAQKWSMPEDVSFFSKNLRLPHDLAEIVGERNATETE